MSERRLARDPLADLMAVGGDDPEGPRAAGQAPSVAPLQGGTTGRRGGGRDRITVQVETPLAEQVRDAVMWLHGVGVHTTISAIAGDGLRTELQRLAERHNDGRPFPPRSGDVPTGRPPRC